MGKKDTITVELAVLKKGCSGDEYLEWDVWKGKPEKNLNHHLQKEMVRLSSQYSNSMARILMDWDDFLKQNVSTYQTKPSGPEPG